MLLGHAGAYLACECLGCVHVWDRAVLHTAMHTAVLIKRQTGRRERVESR